MTLDTLKHKQWLLRILIFTLVTAMIWLGFSLFRSQQQTGIPADLQKLAIPLNPTINIGVVDRIEQKRAYTAEELQNFPVYRLIRLPNGTEQVRTELPEDLNVEESAVIRPAETPTATPEASVAPSSAPTATSSASPTTSTSPATQQQTSTRTSLPFDTSLEDKVTFQ